jgi:uncharacterized membrane protein
MTLSARPHFKLAWRAFKAHPRVFVASMLVLFGSWVTLELSVVALQRFGAALNVFLHLAFLFLFSGLMVGLHRIALDVVDGGVPQLKRLFSSLDRGPAYLIAFCLYFVSVVVGLLLLVVPGGYVAIRYILFGQVLATQRVGALEALREAATLIRGRWWAMYRFWLAVLALHVAGAALLGIGLAISFPVSLLATSSLYRALQRESKAAGELQPSSRTHLSAGGL